MMAYVSLLLIAILTVATPLYYSDVQSPAGGSGHNTDLSQVITLQYCIIDNCTIMRIDAGQQLDIVYTTESLLIVTPKDGSTSMVITRVDDALPCLEYNNNTTDDRCNAIYDIILSSLIMAVSVCILILHLLFKDLRNLFRKLLLLYNLALTLTAIGTIALQLTHYWIIVNLQTICHTTTIIISLVIPGKELFATNILTYSAYLMYRCYHMKKTISKKSSQFLYRCYTTYAAFTLVLLFFVVIAYDWRTGNGKYTILASGHCFYWNIPSYNTRFISLSLAFINKLFQMMMFSAFLIYHYKFNKTVHVAQISLKYSRQLYRITTAMGATVGLSHFIYVIGGLSTSEFQCIAFMSGNILLFIQQVVIFTSLICTKKMSTLCKAYFSRD